MAENNASITNLHNLLDYDARKFISAEIKLGTSLTKWIKEASSLPLKAVLQRYHDFVKHHVKMLEDFYVAEELISLSYTNRVMEAFIEEADEKLSNCTDTQIKDACLLACIQTINHFKISTYGTSAAFARALEMEKQAAIFHEAEVNEKQIDDRLSQLAEHEINIKAKAPIALTE
jgi:ferritin-like metal-binding protein YciE